MLKKLLAVCYTVVLITCDAEKRSESARKSRFISFDTEKNDIDVSLDFTVPFLSIPVKKAMHSMFGGPPDLGIPKINLNPSALAFGGIMVLASSVFIPLLTKNFDMFNKDRAYRGGTMYSHFENKGKKGPLRNYNVSA